MKGQTLAIHDVSIYAITLSVLGFRFASPQNNVICLRGIVWGELQAATGLCFARQQHAQRNNFS
jgi:hypothetical protein